MGAVTILDNDISLQDKLGILADSAKYDVACTSSGVARSGKSGSLGNTSAAGICHTFTGDGRCVSLLKILMTNECVFDCKYCVNRRTNDVPRATFSPREICTLVIEFYRRNYIEGLFLSSGVIKNPTYTMEQMCETLRMLREDYGFHGYIHCKGIPGAPPELVEQAGWYADRMSINLELPTEQGLLELAPNKTRQTILTPMRQIQEGMAESQLLLGMKGGNRSAYYYTQKRQGRRIGIGAIERDSFGVVAEKNNYSVGKNRLTNLHKRDTSRGFVPAGQSTQMIIGASGETDYQIISVTEALYQRFDLKRVFFSAFINVNQDETLPAVNGQPPLRREHRLYQADFLLRYYGYDAQELLSRERPNFNTYLDPKCDWALGHLEHFPVEIGSASYDTLLRVPGIGPKSARRIVEARKTGKLDYNSLKAIGVVLKRAVYFITCYGKMLYPFLKIDEDYITRNLLAKEPDVMKGYGEKVTYKQLSMFEDFQISN